MRSVVAVLAVAAALLASACASASAGASPTVIPVHPSDVSSVRTSERPEAYPTGQPYSDAEFWARTVPGGDNVEHYDSLKAMTQAADAVVVGRIISIGTDPARYKGVDLQGAMYATLTLTIDQVVGGAVTESAPSQLDLAIFMTDPRDYDRFAARLPSGRALLFLRNSLAEAKDAGQPPLPGDDHYYRVVSNQGALLDMAAGTQSASATDPFLESLSKQTFDSVVTLVGTYR